MEEDYVEEEGGEEDEYQSDYVEDERPGHFNPPPPPPQPSQPKRLKYNKPSSTLDMDLALAVDVLESTKSSLNIAAIRLSGAEAQEQLQIALQHFAQCRQLKHQQSTVSLEDIFQTYLTGLAALIKAVDKHANETGIVLERALKRASYQASALARERNAPKLQQKMTLLLVALLRDKCLNKFEDCKFLCTMLSLRVGVGGISSLNNLLKVYPKKPSARAAGRVSHDYYRAREALILNNAELALQLFTQAFDEIPNSFAVTKPQVFRNKRRIFRRILPLRLICSGQTPSPALLNRFDMQACWDAVYAPLLHSARQGDAESMLAHLAKHQVYLQMLDCYALLRKALLAVCRLRQIKIASEVLGNPMPLTLLNAVLPLSQDGGSTRNVEQLTFCLADLCSRGLLSGYVNLQYLILYKGPKPCKSLREAQEKVYRKQFHWLI